MTRRRLRWGIDFGVLGPPGIARGNVVGCGFSQFRVHGFPDSRLPDFGARGLLSTQLGHRVPLTRSLLVIRLHAFIPLDICF